MTLLTEYLEGNGRGLGVFGDGMGLTSSRRRGEAAAGWEQCPNVLIESLPRMAKPILK